MRPRRKHPFPNVGFKVDCTSGPIFEVEKMNWYPGPIFSVKWAALAQASPYSALVLKI